MAAHYYRSRGPLLFGDDAASPAVVDAATPAKTDDTALLDQPLVKAAISGAAIFHGYRRTNSVMWALVYGLAARISPVVTGAVVAAQGFGEVKKGT